MSASVYIALPLMALLAILQATILPRFPVLGLVPQLAFLCALSWGLLRGPNEGTLWAFCAGLMLDLFSVGPVGATSLAYIAAVLVATWIARAFPANRLVLPVLLAAFATLISLLLYALLLRLLGQLAEDLQGLTELAPMMILHGGLILPIYWLMIAIHRVTRPRPVTI